MPRIFGNRFGNVSQADGYLDDKKSVYNMFDQYFSSRRFGWFSKVVASGGTEITTDQYKYHVFLSPGTLTITTGGRVDYLVVGNGGNGGSVPSATRGSGGGGGGVNVGTNYVINSPQSVVVGSASPNPGVSSFGSIPAGRGENANPGFLAIGAGGDSGTPDPFAGGAAGPTPPAGVSGGGGGGAGGGGNPAPTAPIPTSGGKGGGGKLVAWASSSILSPAIPSPVRPSWISAVGFGYYGGGGGGGRPSVTSPIGADGGLGGGGSGAHYNFTPPATWTLNTEGSNGVTHTGGGGGGGGNNRTGGSGIVIIRYEI